MLIKKNSRPIIVIDTNIWIDWFVFSDPSVQILKNQISKESLQIVINSHCLEELQKVIGYSFAKRQLNQKEQITAIAKCLEITKFITENNKNQLLSKTLRCADSSDQKFIELSIVSNADYLITRDLALLALERKKCHKKFHILSLSKYNSLFEVK